MTDTPTETPAMFVVLHRGKCHGPFLEYEVGTFCSELAGDVEVMPLLAPREPDEHRGPVEVKILEEDDYRRQIDSVKIDTRVALVGISQEFHFARRDGRVLTAREIHRCWEYLGRAIRAVESLMHYAEQVVAEPTPENLDALRKAFWRNRDSDDVDPHYRDRFW